jgi:hypothetical protein
MKGRCRCPCAVSGSCAQDAHHSDGLLDLIRTAKTVVTFVSKLPACVVVMVPCCGAHPTGQALAARDTLADGTGRPFTRVPMLVYTNTGAVDPGDVAVIRGRDGI